MCGIAGEIRFDGAPADVAAVGRITAAMQRRGPDGTGVHAAGRVAFGGRSAPTPGRPRSSRR